MKDNQSDAWDCLTPQEQHSLNLTLAQGLSTWEVGEILKITHYKYLELKARSEKLFKLFSDYFAIYPGLIRPACPVDERFRDYLYGSILKRLPKDEALLYAGDSAWLVHSISMDKVVESMKIIKESDEAWDKDLYKLVMEFDRWNNFRILPRVIQAPSAYKRRSTKKDKVYLRYLHRIPEYKIRALVDIYWRKGRPDKRYFTAFISEDVFPKTGYAIVPIKRDKKILKELTDLRIYIFEDQEDAELFGHMVNLFFEKTIDNKSGLKFWKEYRELIELAINYKEINNLDFTCDSLDMAYKLKRKSRKKSSSKLLE